MIRTLTVASVAALLLQGSLCRAGNLGLVSQSVEAGQTATVPLALTGDGNDLSLVSFTVSQPAALPAPSAIAGTDQPNLQAQDVFVDALGGGLYRVSAFVRSGPDMANSGGAVVGLQYDLAGVPLGTYSLNLTTAVLCTNTAGREAVGLMVGGQIEVVAPDTTPPTSTLAPLADSTLATATLCLGFTAADTENGVSATTLWVKTPGSGAFANTGLSQPGTSGLFCYAFPADDGYYEFATAAVDTEANAEANPTTAEVGVLVNTAPNTTFTVVVASTSTTLVFPMTDTQDVRIELVGATPGGTVSVVRETSTTIPAYFRVPGQVVRERLEITPSGLGTTFQAALMWPTDSVHTDGIGPIDRAFAFEGGIAPAATYPAMRDGHVFRIENVTGFSTWYLGNDTAVPVGLAEFGVE